jgi:hypothetical protein
MDDQRNSSTLIYTSNWGTALPNNFKRIGISRGTPRHGPGGYRVYRPLQPGEWWADCASNEEFRQRYFTILGRLNPQQVVTDLVRLADGKIPALLCWEPPSRSSQWCHRGLAAAWLHDELGLQIKEFGHEGEGWGWAHPKLPPEFRRQA